MLDTPVTAKAAHAESPKGDTEDEIRQYLDEWVEAINTGAVEDVTALYSRNAVLLGTFDPTPLTTAAGRKNYFVHFKARKNLTAAIDECHIEALGDNAGTANGLYTFRFLDGNGAPQTVKARFTFVYARQSEGDWLIVAHHSSMRPNP